MAYFNFKLLEKKELNVRHLIALQLLFQSSFEYNPALIAEFSQEIKELTEKGYAKINKTPKKHHELERTRLNKKGNEFYKDLQLKDVTEKDVVLCEYLVKLWEEYDLKIGNKTKCKKLLAQFFAESGYDRKAVYFAIKDYYLHEQSEIDNGKYIPKLENFIWKPSNIYSQKFKLEESRLFEYLENKFGSSK